MILNVKEEAATVMVVTACITTDHRSFSCIH